ncbi:hypothetical protein BS47DRAFT_1358693 [Hydnum rufescens UP504]|uniref:Uncharacterized protein n=1 Tax=Hydnum rufescens UP504 TaxID=1448309 RepID=A0A9P6DXK5_9AGAM|nr:hypothetical protein BS47DRAFT_1358693 [Hydnum rufescens UP504]
MSQFARAFGFATGSARFALKALFDEESGGYGKLATSWWFFLLEGIQSRSYQNSQGLSHQKERARSRDCPRLIPISRQLIGGHERMEDEATQKDATMPFKAISFHLGDFDGFDTGQCHTISTKVPPCGNYLKEAGERGRKCNKFLPPAVRNVANVKGMSWATPVRRMTRYINAAG